MLDTSGLLSTDGDDGENSRRQHISADKSRLEGDAEASVNSLPPPVRNEKDCTPQRVQQDSPGTDARMRSQEGRSATPVGAESQDASQLQQSTSHGDVRGTSGGVAGVAASSAANCVDDGVSDVPKPCRQLPAGHSVQISQL